MMQLKFIKNPIDYFILIVEILFKIYEMLYIPLLDQVRLSPSPLARISFDSIGNAMGTYGLSLDLKSSVCFVEFLESLLLRRNEEKSFLAYLWVGFVKEII